MKIALVILHADPSRGGAERYTVDLAAALARRGHEISILASSFAEPIENVRFVPLDHRGATRAGKYLRFLDSLDEHLKENRYDIVHAMLPVRTCDLYHPHAGIAAEALERWTVHFNPRRRAMAKVERALLRKDRPPVVLALSEYIKGFIRKHYPLPHDRLQTLFNAVDLTHFDPARRDIAPALSPMTAAGDPYAFTLLTVAQDFQRKGLWQAIEAMSLLESWYKPCRLVVVGEDGRGPYEKLADQLEVDVQFVGGVADTRPYYRCADLLVLPTRHDPCSLVVLEALAMGVPVISTKFNGACEIMEESHGVVLDDPENVPALAEAMRRMMNESLPIKQRACLELRPKLSYEHHLDRLIGIYERVVRGRG